MHSSSTRLLTVAALAAALAACGGGTGTGSGSPSGGGAPTAEYSGPATDPPATKGAAARFLTQATFGPNAAEIEKLGTLGYSRWVEQQMAMPPGTPHQDYFAARTAELDQNEQVSENWVYESWWKAALSSDDQLRHRIAYALSQIFVISLQDDTVNDYPRGVANYMDMLGRNAFGNFRTLLQDVTMHPMMGLYLTHLRNQKGDPASGRVPDENYAREVMQLFTIGLHELNGDGTVRLDSRGEPIETYRIEDIVGLARVFTGLSWGGPDTGNARFFGTLAHSDRDIVPMRGYPQHHETGPKAFLGATVNGSTPEESVGAALDHLFRHPNVGPFIGKRLIQQLVTSNPSPGYVARVAAAFDNNGRGERGDLKAVIRAILLDPEARDDAAVASPTAGKLREPVMRVTAWLRAFDAKSTNGTFPIRVTDDPSASLGQTPMRAPTVFNFFRPGYVPPNTTIAQAKLVSPEMQIVQETTVAAWLNLMRTSVDRGGFGDNAPSTNVPDVSVDLIDETAIADNAAELVDRIALLLTADQMPASVRQRIVTSVSSISVASTVPTTRENARRNRVRLATYLTLASPEFLVQK